MSRQMEGRGDHLSLPEQASDWLLRLQSAPDDHHLAADFERWRNAAPEHEAAWERISRAWNVLGDLRPHSPYAEPCSGPFHAGRRASNTGARASGWQWISLCAGAAMAALLVILVSPEVLLHLKADHMTTGGERQLVSLPDGSTVHLAGASAISTDFQNGIRHVTLLRGEAFFDVRHDSGHPFVVDVGPVNVEVLGTAFDVRFGTDATDISLLRGSVRAGADAGTGIESYALVPGQRLRRSADGRLRKEQVPLGEIGAWRDGRLYVSDATVRSVAEQIGRYHSAWISIADTALADQRVTGVYDLADPDRALRALAGALGARVFAISPYLRIISRL